MPGETTPAKHAENEIIHGAKSVRCDYGTAAYFARRINHAKIFLANTIHFFTMIGIVLANQVLQYLGKLGDSLDQIHVLYGEGNSVERNAQ